MDRSAHWNAVYQAKRSEEVSWYQLEPTTSLLLMERLGIDASS
jgi:transglutaminase-like putative cysteine protease